MQLKSRKSGLLLAVALTALLVPAQAREDQPDPPAWMMPFDDLSTAAWLASIEPGAGGTLAVAMTPDPAETPNPAPSETLGKQLGAFASVAISAGSLPSAWKWRGVVATDYAELFTKDCRNAGFEACENRLVTQLQAARQTAADQSGLAVLDTVNLAVNDALPYGSDRASWGTGDYWATPVETAARGVGDCEDYATMKMWMLRSLGVPAEALQLVVLEDVKQRIYHAVLAVHLGGEIYILDNRNGRVAKDSAYPSYVPIMSFVGGRSYIHGFERRRSETADAPADLAVVAPGEGV